MKEGQTTFKCGVTMVWDSKGNLMLVSQTGETVEIPEDNVPQLQATLYPIAEQLIGKYGI